MQKFLIIFSLLISIFLLQNCSIPKAIKPLKTGVQKEITTDDFIPTFHNNNLKSKLKKLLFQKRAKSLLFKSNLSYGDKFDLGGLLAIKEVSEGNYRTIFMTIGGATLLDFEFGKKGFIVHKTLKVFNKKIFLKILEQDLAMLLAKDVLSNQGTIYGKEQGDILVSKSYQKTYFQIHKKIKKPTKIYKAKRVTISIEYRSKNPKNILIEHHKIPLKIKLRLIRG